MKSNNEIGKRRLLRDWEVLCTRIGERLAGTGGERRAAAYIAEQFAAAGLTGVHAEEFPCTSLRRARPKVQPRHGSRWRTAPAMTLVGARDARRQDRRGRMQWLEMPENAGRLARNSLRGRIAVIFGPLPTVRAHHRALVAAAPAAVIQVDDRLPFNWPKSDGVYPLWVRRHGMPTTVTVPYTTAWGWRRTGVHRARVQVQVEQVAASSQNVVGVLPGRDPQLPEIIMMAHHDTQCGNPGADDNASGVVCVLELARLFAGRTVGRCASFLSARRTALRRRRRLRAATPRGDEARGLVVNFDSVACCWVITNCRVGPARSPAMPRRTCPPRPMSCCERRSRRSSTTFLQPGRRAVVVVLSSDFPGAAGSITARTTRRERFVDDPAPAAGGGAAREPPGRAGALVVSAGVTARSGPPPAGWGANCLGLRDCDDESPGDTQNRHFGAGIIGLTAGLRLSPRAGAWSSMRGDHAAHDVGHRRRPLVSV